METLQKYIDKLNKLNFKEMYNGDFFLTWEKTDDEIEAVFTVADALRYMRENNISTKVFESGLGISLFRDNSTRTRFSFASACNLLGLEVQDLDEGKSQVAHGETVRETANMKEDAGRGYRRVVASPKPAEIIEIGTIRTMVDAGNLVIACGGGGIPVIRQGNHLKGASAVIDKDFASCLLAKELEADSLIILTAVEKVAVNFGRENEKWLDRLSVAEAGQYVKEGHFAPGSMLPKVQAAMEFASSGEGRTAIITLLEKSREAIQGKTGTVFHA